MDMGAIFSITGSYDLARRSKEWSDGFEDLKKSKDWQDGVKEMENHLKRQTIKDAIIEIYSPPRARDNMRRLWSWSKMWSL